MKKSELIELLSDPDLPDLEVYVSSDAEGNSFGEIDEVSYEREDDDSGFIEEYGPALIIWPV